VDVPAVGGTLGSGGASGGAAAGAVGWVPLRIAPGRVRLWAVGLFLIGLAPIVAAPFFGFHDWPVFWSAGSVVGSGNLVDGNRLIAWETSRGLSVGVFPYLPASAFVLWPLAQLPLAAGFWIWAVAMLASAALAARIAARVFGLPVWVAVGAALAWAPLTGAIVIGQNTPLALLLAMLAIKGLVAGESVGVSAGEGAGELVAARRGWIAAGLGSGLLLYKPTLGLPLVALLVLRRRDRALALVAVALVAWYVVGVLAAGGDLGWPRVWLDTITGYVADDAARNADKAISLVGLIARLPVAPIVPLVAGALVVLGALPRLIRARIREAAAGACLIGLAVSPHAYGYEAALAMPFIWWVLGGGIAEPWRTRLIVASYALVPLWLLSAETRISAVAVVVLGWVVVWILGLWRGDRVLA
jgi:Glycosyltransferase family 87